MGDFLLCRRRRCMRSKGETPPVEISYDFIPTTVPSRLADGLLFLHLMVYFSLPLFGNASSESEAEKKPRRKMLSLSSGSVLLVRFGVLENHPKIDLPSPVATAAVFHSHPIPAAQQLSRSERARAGWQAGCLKSASKKSKHYAKPTTTTTKTM